MSLSKLINLGLSYSVYIYIYMHKYITLLNIILLIIITFIPSDRKNTHTGTIPVDYINKYIIPILKYVDKTKILKISIIKWMYNEIIKYIVVNK